MIKGLSRITRARLLLALIFATLPPGPASATNYLIDPKETRAEFELWFLGLLPLQGKFLRTAGTLEYDRATRHGSIDVIIDATTLAADNPRAQGLARGPEFFAVEKYPVIAFRSSRFVFGVSQLETIEGSLTLVGSTRPVVLTVIDSRCEVAVKLEPARCHAAAELVIKRSAFGMKAWPHAVSEEVTIRIAISARQSAEIAAPAASATPAKP